MRRIKASLALAAVLLLTGAGPAPSVLRGEFRRDCAPYDGPAFAIVLAAREPGTEFWLRANIQLEKAVGTWRAEGQSSAGTGSIVHCRNLPQTRCDHPESGSFTVTRQTADRLEGSFDVLFRQGKRFRHRFIATPSPSRGRQLLCG